MTVLMTLNDTKDTFFGDHFGAVSTGRRLALVRRHLVEAFVLRSAGTKRTNDVRHTPDSILVRYKNVIVVPSQPVRFVQVLNMAAYPCSPSAAIVSQKCQISNTLLGDQDVTVGQDKQPPGIDKACRKRRRGEARRHLQCLSVVRYFQ